MDLKSTEVALSYKSVDYLSYGVPLLNSAKEDTKILVNEENIGYNFNSNSLESLINKLSEININEIDIMKRKSYNIYKKNYLVNPIILIWTTFYKQLIKV